MNSVIVRQYGGPLVVRLNATQRKLFLRELARVRRHFPRGKGPPLLVAPDCTITVRLGKRVSHYSLYTRAVLMERRRKATWQFYFGLLLMEWLH